MTLYNDSSPGTAALTTEAVDVMIRLGLLGLLGYWSWGIIAPFLTIVLWSAILTVALYPLFDRLAGWLGRRRLAAALVTLLCLLVVVVPVAWLGLGMVSGVKLMAKEVDAGLPSIPLPANSVKDWPIVGEKIFQIWSRVVTDIKAQLVELAPVIKPVGRKLLEIAMNAMLGLLKFLVSIIIAGLLFCPGPKLVERLAQIIDRILHPRGLEMVHLAGATIRNVSRGVIGIALLQSLLGGVGFLAAGIPGAGILAFASLFLRNCSDRTSARVLAGHHLELDRHGDRARLVVYGLHAPRWPSRQSSQADADGARPGDTNACHHHWCNRGDDGLWDNWPLFRTNCSSVAWQIMVAWMNGDNLAIATQRSEA